MLNLEMMMATEVEERQQDAPREQHGDSITHAFILEQMRVGFAEVNARIDRLLIVLVAGQFAIVASIIGVAVASFLLN